MRSSSADLALDGRVNRDRASSSRVRCRTIASVHANKSSNTSQPSLSREVSSGVSVIVSVLGLPTDVATQDALTPACLQDMPNGARRGLLSMLERSCLPGLDQHTLKSTSDGSR